MRARGGDPTTGVGGIDAEDRATCLSNVDDDDTDDAEGAGGTMKWRERLRGGEGGKKCSG